MSLSQTLDKISKSLANIAKLGRAELADKAKAAAIKDVNETMKKGKEFEKKQTDLNKRIKDAKTLAKDIESYKKEWNTYVQDANKLAQTVNKLSPDTKGRDYFMMANYLTQVGQAQFDDYP